MDNDINTVYALSKAFEHKVQDLNYSIKYKDIEEYLIDKVISEGESPILSNGILKGIFNVPYSKTQKTYDMILDMSMFYGTDIHTTITELEIDESNEYDFNHICDTLMSKYKNLRLKNDGSVVDENGEAVFNRYISHILLAKEMDLSFDDSTTTNLLRREDIKIILDYVNDTELMFSETIKDDSEFVLSKDFLTWTSLEYETCLFTYSIMLYNKKVIEYIDGRLLTTDKTINSIKPIDTIKQLYVGLKDIGLTMKDGIVYENGEVVKPSYLDSIWLLIDGLIHIRLKELQYNNLSDIEKKWYHIKQVCKGYYKDIVLKIKSFVS